jgi:hypothetical protein
VILGKETLRALDIFSSFPGGCRVTNPTNLIFEGARHGVPGVEYLLNFILFLSLDDEGRGSGELGLRRQGIVGGRLQKFDGEHWVNRHGSWEVKLISLGSNVFKNLAGA